MRLSREDIGLTDDQIDEVIDEAGLGCALEELDYWTEPLEDWKRSSAGWYICERTEERTVCGYPAIFFFGVQCTEKHPFWKVYMAVDFGSARATYR